MILIISIHFYDLIFAESAFLRSMIIVLVTSNSLETDNSN